MSRPKGTMKAATLDNSKRLQRLMHYLSDLKERTTLEIIQGANICAVNSAIAELRVNLEPYGMAINCRRLDKNRWAYQLQLRGRTV